MTKIVFTNGCFDVLHVGHVRYLSDARALGDKLIVGLNSDSSIKRLKGDLRPIVSEEHRKEMLLALKVVDEVQIFNEDNPWNLINKIQPDVLVKGGDWPVDKIIGSDIVLKKGGEVLSLPFYEGNSTTGIIEKVLSVYGA